MSTTFGVIIPTTGEIHPIARRRGIGNGKIKLTYTNPLGKLLPDNIEVIPIDNSAQGIYTIGDINQKIKEEEDG